MKKLIIVAFISLVVSGCGTSQTMSKADIEKRKSDSVIIARLFDALPLDADVENLDDQLDLTQSGLYKNWKGQIRPLKVGNTDSVQSNTRKPVPLTPKFEEYNPGKLQPLEATAPIDIMRGR